MNRFEVGCEANWFNWVFAKSVFAEFAKFSDKKYLSLKSDTSCVRDQDATLNSLNSMKFLLHLGKPLTEFFSIPPMNHPYYSLTPIAEWFFYISSEEFMIRKGWSFTNKNPMNTMNPSRYTLIHSTELQSSSLFLRNYLVYNRSELWMYTNISDS